MGEVDEAVIYRAIMKVLDDGHLCDAEPNIDSIPCPLMHAWEFPFTYPVNNGHMHLRSDFARTVIVEVNRQVDAQRRVTKGEGEG